jgi:hypothetical protein
MAIVYVANTNNLELRGLKSVSSGEFINDAVVTVTIKDGKVSDSDLAGESWPLTMEYVVGSDGDYRVGLTHTLPFVAKHHYTAIIDSEVGSPPERTGHWEFPFKASTRTGA